MISPKNIAIIHTAWAAIQDKTSGATIELDAVSIHTGWCNHHHVFELTVIADGEMIACTDVKHRDAFHAYCTAVMLMGGMMRNAARLQAEQDTTKVDNILRSVLGDIPQEPYSETWYADGIRVPNKDTAFNQRQEYAETRFFNDSGDYVYTRWYTDTRIERGKI